MLSNSAHHTVSQSGYTLIELMMVITIIGVLAAIAIPQYQNHVAKTQTIAVISELAQQA